MTPALDLENKTGRMNRKIVRAREQNLGGQGSHSCFLMSLMPKVPLGFNLFIDFAVSEFGIFQICERGFFEFLPNK